jgi:hypothetical protein
VLKHGGIILYRKVTEVGAVITDRFESNRETEYEEVVGNQGTGCLKNMAQFHEISFKISNEMHNTTV